jgi:hypothetical protein
MLYRELDDETRHRADLETRAREDLHLRASLGRQRRNLALVVAPHEHVHRGLAPYREDIAARSFAWSLGTLAGIAGFMATLEHFAGSWATPPAAIVGLFCLLVGQRVGIWAAPSLLRLTAVPWMRRLPFPMRGFMATHLLARPPAAVVLRVEVDGPQDDLVALLADLVWQVDDATTVRREGDVLVVRSDGENRGQKPIQVWIREIVDEALVPLAAIHPVHAVTVAIQR